MTFEEIQKIIEEMLAVQKELQQDQLRLQEMQLRDREQNQQITQQIQQLLAISRDLQEGQIRLQERDIQLQEGQMQLQERDIQLQERQMQLQEGQERQRGNIEIMVEEMIKLIELSDRNERRIEQLIGYSITSESDHLTLEQKVRNLESRIQRLENTN